MPARRWLLLNSPQYRDAVATVLRDAGEAVVDPPADWSPRNGLAPETPDAVAVDHNAGKKTLLVAGFYCGYGLPVILFASRRGHWEPAERLARTLGFWTLDAVPELAAMLAADHPYFSRRQRGQGAT